jgi:diaminopimelate decarboxylase
VYDTARIRERYEEVDSAFGDIPHRIHYSVKANCTLAVLGLIRGLGAGADIVSGGELQRVLRAGFDAADVVFSGVGKTDAELSAALQAGVGLVNIESAGELDILGRLAGRSGRPVRLGIRVNPDVTTDTHPYTQTGASGMKFGVPLNEVRSLAQSAAEHDRIHVVSVGMHLGSQILDSSKYRLGARTLARLVREMRADGIATLENVDLGGGWGIRYRDELPLDPAAVAGAVRPLFEATGLPLVVEPGRYLVGGAGVLLTRCLYRKHSGGKDFAVVDAGMNDLLRPSLYGAYHEIQLVASRPVPSSRPHPGAPADPPSPGLEQERALVDVVGPLCETGDFLGLDRGLGLVEPGTLLAVCDVGAYGFVMASNYNSRPRPPEVLVDNGRWAVVRERESEADLMRGERTVDEIPLGGGWRGTGDGVAAC